MDTFTRGGLTFDVTDAGPADGTVVVLLHGFPQNRHCWDAVTPQLTDAGYRVLAPDQRGYSPGARPRGRRAYVLGELVDDVLALIDAAGAEKVHLVGHDWGATVAWALAATHPQRLHSLTAVSVPHLAAFTWALPRGQLIKSWYMLAFQIPGLAERFMTTSAGGRFMAEPDLPVEAARAYVRALGRDGLTAALNWYRALALGGRGHGFGRPSTVPTLYVWSDGDHYLGRAAAEATERFVRAPYRFVALQGVSHWIPEAAPERFGELLLEQVAQAG